MKKRQMYGAVLKLTREDTPETIEENLLKMREARTLRSKQTTF